MDTWKRVEELRTARDISLFKLAQMCHLGYSSLKASRGRQSQLSVDTIETICDVLGITLIEFFDVPNDETDHELEGQIKLAM